MESIAKIFSSASGLLFWTLMWAGAGACTANTFVPTDPGKNPDSNVKPEPGGAGDDSPLGAAPPGGEYYEVSPAQRISKVKNFLTGLLPNDEEILQGTTEAGLRELVHAWLQTPEADVMLRDYFKIAFQQQFLGSMSNIVPFGNGPNNQVAQALLDSFSRTALYTVRNKQPFTNLYGDVPKLILASDSVF